MKGSENLEKIFIDATDATKDQYYQSKEIAPHMEKLKGSKLLRGSKPLRDLQNMKEFLGASSKYSAYERQDKRGYSTYIWLA